MYSGTNIILTTNNETMIELLSSELVQLRNIDSILIRNYSNTLETIESEKPQAVIINCQNSMEEALCLDLIKRIKEISSIPIILIVENYNARFIRIANKAGISDVVSIMYGNSEILMRTIWSLQKNELRQQHKKYEKLLMQLSAIDEKTGFYTPKVCTKIFNNELEYIKSRGIDGVFLAIEPNKNSRLRPSTDNIIETIKNNIRSSDIVCQTKSANTFYLLLENTNLEGALVVWTRINKSIGAEETLCASIVTVSTNSQFEGVEPLLKEGLEKAQTAPDLLYLIDIEHKQDENWLENTSLNPTNNGKDFKLFRQIFNKKLENVIKPTIDELLKEYEEILVNTDTPIVETENSYTVKFVNKRQESEFIVLQEGKTISISSVHNGLDSPENKVYTLNLNDITKREIENDFEEFILEFKSCL